MTRQTEQEGVCCDTGCATERAAPPERPAPTHRAGRAGALRRALGLEYLTVGWNVVEGVVAVAAALAAGSVALLGFGIDSFVESTSGLILIWRLRAETSGVHGHAVIETIEHRARRWVGLSLFALAAWIAYDAVTSLWGGERPDTSVVGIVLTAVSVVVMQWLARAKRRAAAELGSKALEADAFQTTACVYLSIAALAGMALNAALGWWWADPAAALVIAVLVVREGREAWEGKDCC